MQEGKKFNRNLEAKIVQLSHKAEKNKRQKEKNEKIGPRGPTREENTTTQLLKLWKTFSSSTSILKFQVPITMNTKRPTPQPIRTLGIENFLKFPKRKNKNI